MERTRPSSEWWALVALALIGAGLACIALLHVLEPGLSPLTTYLSDYGESPHRAVLTATYVLMGLGGVALGFALRHEMEGSLAVGAGGILLALAGAAVLGMVVWPVGTVHVGIVRAEEGALLVSIGLMTYGVHRKPAWRSLTPFSWLVVGLTALGVVRVERFLPWPGLVQRAYLLVVMAWVVLVARHAATARAPAATRASA